MLKVLISPMEKMQSGNIVQVAVTKIIVSWLCMAANSVNTKSVCIVPSAYQMLCVT